MSRDALVLLDDILQGASKVLIYSDGLGRDELFRDPMRFEAVLYNLHVIGEAVKKLPEPFRDANPQVAWREIAGMRDIIVHAYFALDLDILWSAIQVDVPGLLQEVRVIVERTRASRLSSGSEGSA